MHESGNSYQVSSCTFRSSAEIRKRRIIYAEASLVAVLGQYVEGIILELFNIRINTLKSGHITTNDESHHGDSIYCLKPFKVTKHVLCHTFSFDVWGSQVSDQN